MEKMEEAMKAMQQGQEYVHDKVTKHEEVLQGARAPTTTSRAHEATTPSRRPPGLMAQGCLDEEEEDAGDAQQETPANTNANTSKTRQVEGGDTDEPEADGGGGGRVPPGAHAGGMPTPNPAHYRSEEAWAAMEEEMARLRQQHPPKVEAQEFFADALTQMVQSFKSMAESGQSAARILHVSDTRTRTTRANEVDAEATLSTRPTRAMHVKKHTR